MPKRLTTKQAATYLTDVEGVPVAPGTLEVWRVEGIRKGPSFRKVHNRVFYLVEDLAAFAEGTPVKTTDTI